MCIVLFYRTAAKGYRQFARFAAALRVSSMMMTLRMETFALTIDGPESFPNAALSKR